jgi:hypothetical protein
MLTAVARISKPVQSIGGSKAPFPIPKRSQFFIRTHNEALFVATMSDAPKD